MVNGEKEFMIGENMMRFIYSVIVRWIKEFWDLLFIDIVCYLFKMCRISNNMDGFEDDVFYSNLEFGCEIVGRKILY